MIHKDFKYGNLAHVHLNVGNIRDHKQSTLVTVLNVTQDTTTGFYNVNCMSTRDGTPYFDVPVMGIGQPLENSMGILFFLDSSADNPVLLPLGW